MSMFVDEKKLIDETSAVLVPKLIEGLNQLLPPLIAELKDILPGLKITITIERPPHET